MRCSDDVGRAQRDFVVGQEAAKIFDVGVAGLVVTAKSCGQEGLQAHDGTDISRPSKQGE